MGKTERQRQRSSGKKKSRKKVSLPPAERELWTAKDLRLRYDLSEPTFWRMRKDGKIPPPDVRVGVRDYWRRDHILAREQTSAQSV